MGKRYTKLDGRLQAFIEQQKIFFVATAVADGRVNVSPKGMDSLRVLAPDRLVWLNVTGSGNETAAHVQEQPRMTLMWAAFEGSPMILRVYGRARVVHWGEPDWPALYSLLPTLPGARQVFDVQVELVQTSCGMGVPLFQYAGEREQLNRWAQNKGPEGIRAYWHDKNRFSLDGRPTRIEHKTGLEEG